MTSDRDFVVDRLPDIPQVFVGLGAAHGFKFASWFGRTLAGLACGEPTDPELAPFAFDPPVVARADLTRGVAGVSEAMSGAVRAGARDAAMPDDPPIEDLDRLEQALLDNIAELDPPAALGDREQPIRRGSALTGAVALELFEAQLLSRHVDHTARWLRSRAPASTRSDRRATRAMPPLPPRCAPPTRRCCTTDRVASTSLARRQVPGHDGVRDVLAGMLALADEPIAGGRHKVFGHPDLAVIPQTSTIASHLPRALGVAFAIGRAKRLGVPTAWPVDALAVCSFGDASANHSTAQGAINAAWYTAHQGLPLPLLFVCEDNGWGISVPTPSGWIETAFGDIGRASVRAGRRQQRRRHATTSPLDLAGWVRTNRRPALPAPAHGALHGPRRHRRRIGLPLGRVDP